MYPHESVREFVNAIRRLVNRTYPSIDLYTQDMLTRDHFILHVGSGDLRMQLHSAKPTGLEEAVGLAVELEMIQELEKELPSL